jgi:large subunit ribosomal protein L4
MPYNITAAVAKIKGLSLMPTYGLNVYSMLKHDTLVITLRTLDKLESKLLSHMNSLEFRDRLLTKK